MLGIIFIDKDLKELKLLFYLWFSFKRFITENKDKKGNKQCLLSLKQ